MLTRLSKDSASQAGQAILQKTNLNFITTMPKYFRWSDTVVDSTGESYSSAITMGNDPYNGGKNFKVLCENTTGDWTFPVADWRQGLCKEITAEEAKSYL